MIAPSQTTKIRLLQYLQDPLHNGKPVSLNRLAETFGVSRERVRQFYRQLAKTHVLPPVKSNRGFASMDKERLRLIVSNAGITAHKLGRAHKWTSEEARAAGKKGGAARTGKKYTIRIV